MGLVFASFTSTSDNKGERGEVYTYTALLQEVKKVGGDGMVNVRIEQTFKNDGKKFLGIPIKSKNRGTTVWHGSATAVKYTNSIKNVQATVTNEKGSSTVNTESYSMASSSGTGLLKGKFSFKNIFKKK